jgi:hypothetical protein
VHMSVNGAESAREIDRNEPGSAFVSQASIACACGAIILCVAVFMELTGDMRLWSGSVLSWIAVGVWSLGAVGMGVVAWWAERDRNNPELSLADLMLHRVIGTMIMVVALFAGMLLVPLSPPYN